MNTSKLLRLFAIAFVSTMVSNAHADNSTCTIDLAHPGASVAAICRGQQIEEFNYQFEGGLYAQLIKNPSFEELKNPIAGWTLVKPGTSEATLSSQTQAETGMLNDRQGHCLKLAITSVSSGSVGVANAGYWGIALRNDTPCKVSFWVRKGPNFTGRLSAKLEGADGVVYAQSAEFEPTTEWRHFTCDLIPSGISTVNGANRFVIYASAPGDVYLDVLTVMPPTWKKRSNGLRLDLAERLAALKLTQLSILGKGFDYFRGSSWWDDASRA